MLYALGLVISGFVGTEIFFNLPSSLHLSWSPMGGAQVAP